MRILLCVLAILTSAALADTPIPFQIPWAASVPNQMAARSLVTPHGDLPAVTVKDGHFYAGDKRIRFWGVNLAFSANFPTHEEADALADRLSSFGVNCVRLHHMDSQPFPNGIFADATLTTLSPDALDRLDYLLAALKKRGVYADLNLHVSRHFAASRHLPNAKAVPDDKMVDLFFPAMIEGQKQYAHDLLSHVNAYTHLAMAADPEIALIEINNEDSLFYWGGREHLANLPEPYAGELQKLWNEWLVKKYGTRAALLKAWSEGVEAAGENLLHDSALATVGGNGSPWIVEQHPPAAMSATAQKEGATIHVSKVDGTVWHLQFHQPGLTLEKGRYYTLTVTASADPVRTLSVSAGQSHDPYQGLGLSGSIKLTAKPQTFKLGFTAPMTDANARITFHMGGEVGNVTLSNITLHTGGQETVAEDENPAKATVRRDDPARADVARRRDDWFDFLQHTEQDFFTSMRTYLRDDLHAKAPITGSIVFGPLGVATESQMDFVDAHAYWDHPRFPGQAWDPNNFLINNTPMSSDPAGATFWGLAAARVRDKPFTVTEYTHAAPNEYQAETIPMIAAYAAAQDWDAVFLFAYSHSHQYAKDHVESYFDIEGNPMKMAHLANGARLFLSGIVHPLPPLVHPFERTDALRNLPSHYFNVWSYLRDQGGVKWDEMLTHAFCYDFGPAAAYVGSSPDSLISWRDNCFLLRQGLTLIATGHLPSEIPRDHAARPGFPDVMIESSPGDFATLMLVPDADGRLLLSIASLAQNTGQTWDPTRHTIHQWGKAPVLCEPVNLTLRLHLTPGMKAYALHPDGTRAGEIKLEPAGEGWFRLTIAGESLWYEIARE